MKRVADPRAAVPIGDEQRRGAESLFAVAQAKRPGDARQARSDGEDLDRVGGADQRMRQGEVRLRALLHRAGNVDQHDDAALPKPPPALAQSDELAGMAHGVAKHAPRIGAGPAARRAPAIAAPPRHARRQRTGKPPQCLALVTGRKTARRKSLGRGRLGAGFTRLVAEDRFGTDRRILRGAYRFFVARFAFQSGNDRAEKVCIEQRVELGETLGRWANRRPRGAADVADLVRAEKLDRGEPRYRLLRRDRKAGVPQQRGETEEVGDWTHRVVHACASARMASIFGAM